MFRRLTNIALPTQSRAFTATTGRAMRQHNKSGAKTAAKAKAPVAKTPTVVPPAQTPGEAEKNKNNLGKWVTTRTANSTTHSASMHDGNSSTYVAVSYSGPGMGTDPAPINTKQPANKKKGGKQQGDTNQSASVPQQQQQQHVPPPPPAESPDAYMNAMRQQSENFFKNDPFFNRAATTSMFSDPFFQRPTFAPSFFGHASPLFNSNFDPFGPFFPFHSHTGGFFGEQHGSQPTQQQIAAGQAAAPQAQQQQVTQSHGRNKQPPVTKKGKK